MPTGRGHARRDRLKSLVIALLVASCGGQSSGPAENATDGAPVDALLDDASDTGDAAVTDAAAGEATAATTMTCDAAVTIAGGDGSTSVGDAAGYFIEGLNLQGGLCLPELLPVEGPGQIHCQILYLLAAGDSCTSHSGLSAAGADVVAAVGAKEPVDSTQPICVLAQLPLAQWVCGSCASSSSAGWCYVIGPAAGNCSQALVVSPSGGLPTAASALLACGTPPSSSAGTGSTQ